MEQGIDKFVRVKLDVYKRQGQHHGNGTVGHTLQGRGNSDFTDAIHIFHLWLCEQPHALQYISVLPQHYAQNHDSHDDKLRGYRGNGRSHRAQLRERPRAQNQHRIKDHVRHQTDEVRYEWGL